MALKDILEPKFKVVWEERRYTFIHAKNREEAELLVRNGEFDQDFSEEITVQPEAIKL